MEAQVRGISSYFKGIASFEQGIANADVDFIKGKLKVFDTKYTALLTKMKKDVREAMIAMTTLLLAQLVEQTIALAAKIAEESNPIAVIFTGVDTKGVRDQAVKVADAAVQLAHGISLFVRLGELATDTIEIGVDLKDNREQITN